MREFKLQTVDYWRLSGADRFSIIINKPPHSDVVVRTPTSTLNFRNINTAIDALKEMVPWKFWSEESQKILALFVPKEAK